MKRIAAFFLTALFLLVSLQQPLYLCLFRVNQAQLTERYCVNKYKKGLDCRGKCYLRQQLAGSEPATGKNPFAVMNLKWKTLETTVLPLPVPKGLWSRPARIRHTLFMCPVPDAVVRTLFKPPCPENPPRFYILSS